jgi:hypothetical protein
VLLNVVELDPITELVAAFVRINVTDPVLVPITVKIYAVFKLTLNDASYVTASQDQ